MSAFEGHVLVWLVFNAAVATLLLADLAVFHRRPRVMRVPEALGWTGFWVALALGFNVLVWFLYRGHWGGFGTRPGEAAGGHEAALQFFTGYLIELSLSVDNLFVFLAIFNRLNFKPRLIGGHSCRSIPEYLCVPSE